MAKEEFVADVLRFTPAKKEELETLTHRQVMEQYVFPHILYPSGQDIRGWRISDAYMAFAYTHASYCLEQNECTGMYMLKFALNRISCGAVVHEKVDLEGPLIPQYKKYGVTYDKPDLMSDECFRFLQNAAANCLTHELTKDHFKKIVFGLLDNLTPEGDTLNNVSLGGLNFTFSGMAVYDWAEETAFSFFGFEECYQHFATPQRWKKYKLFFHTAKEQLSKRDFFKRIGVKGFFEKRRIWKSL